MLTKLEKMRFEYMDLKRYTGNGPRTLEAYNRYIEAGGAKRDKEQDNLLPLYLKKLKG